MIPRTDLHMHSQFSPCSVNTTIADNVRVAKEKGLKVIAITDHGTCKRPEWFNTYLREIERIRGKENIIILKGMEVDVDIDGNLVVDKELLRELDVIIAALHRWPGIGGSALYKWWVKTIRKVAEEGIAWILAHPTDVGWMKLEPPLEYIAEVIDIIKETDMIIEINYHHKDPNDEFLRLCIERKVKMTPTSDAHKLEEIGNFNWYIERITKLGFKTNEVNWLSVDELLRRLNL